MSETTQYFEGKIEAVGAAEAMVNSFVTKALEPGEMVTMDLDQDFGYGIKAGDLAIGIELLTENPPPGSHGERRAGEKWTKVYTTQWSGVYREDDYFKRPNDQFNVGLGKSRLVKRGIEADAEYLS